MALFTIAKSLHSVFFSFLVFICPAGNLFCKCKACDVYRQDPRLLPDFNEDASGGSPLQMTSVEVSVSNVGIPSSLPLVGTNVGNGHVVVLLPSVNDELYQEIINV